LSRGRKKKKSLENCAEAKSSTIRRKEIENRDKFKVTFMWGRSPISLRLRNMGASYPGPTLKEKKVHYKKRGKRESSCYSKANTKE